MSIPVTGEPLIFWMLSPADQRTHAMLAGDAEALCGTPLPTGEARLNRPFGNLCLPCAIGVTADMPDPGRMGTGM